MVYYNQNGRAYNLDEKSFKGGGEGNIYNIIGQPSLVAKIYHANMLDAQIAAKILAYPDFAKGWESNFRLYTVPPIEALFDSNRKFAGYIMDKLVGDTTKSAYHHDNGFGLRLNNLFYIKYAFCGSYTGAAKFQYLHNRIMLKLRLTCKR